jgi:DNA polymerase elongation subunit (family B)
MIYLGKTEDGKEFTDVDLAFDIGSELAARITSLLPKPVKLEFEKVYTNYLLLKKKRYAAKKHMEKGKPGEVDVKGIDSKRRDYAPWHAKVISGVIDRILESGNIDDAIPFCIDQVRALCQHEISIDDLTMTTQYSKSAESYKNSKKKKANGKSPSLPPHLVINKQIIDREGAGAAFGMGSRIPFVIMPALKDTKKSERVKYADYVKKDNDYPCVDWYLEALTKGLNRIFELLKGPTFVQKTIMTGKHMKRKNTVTQQVVNEFFEPRKRTKVTEDEPMEQ